MTANQIAAAGVAEDIRHNKEYEEETKRHNQESEALQEDTNRIQEQYNTRSLDLKEYYDKRYLDYLEASEADKVAIEKELNEIKQQQVDLDDWYKREMATIESRDLDIKESWNAVQENLKQIDQGLVDKQLEYQKHQWDEQNAINSFANDIKLWQQEEEVRYHDMMNVIETNKIEATKQYNKIYELSVSNRQQIDLLNYGLSARKLPFDISYTEAQTDLSKSAKTFNNAKTIDLFNPFSTSRAKVASDTLLDVFK